MNTLAIGEQTREFYRRQGELRERERIIKLLDDHFRTCELMTYECPTCEERINAIALIKGENK